MSKNEKNCVKTQQCKFKVKLFSVKVSLAREQGIVIDKALVISSAGYLHP
jgi:hypothetical protein